MRGDLVEIKKKALITGASEGIGRAIAKKLAAEDYELTLVARNKNRLESLIQDLGKQHKIYICDLTKNEDLFKLASLFSREHFDLLVNNAGQGVYGKFTEVPIEDIMHVFKLNCESLLVLSHAFLKHAKEGDALVNLSSTLAFLPLPASATYCGTKSFVTALSEVLWFEEQKRNVFVMNLCPGLTTTEFFSRAGGGKEGSRKRPPEYMFQSAEQVAEEMYLALEARMHPTWITGRRNRFLSFLTRLLSRKTVVHLMGSVG